ncbi:MAG: tail fiber domain-containing protein [Steroidobacteraceae bacterium]
MNTTSKWAMTLLLLLSGAAYAQVPSTNDTSDGYFNTGMGTNALKDVTPSSCGGTPSGCANTGSGYDALYLNRTGNQNTGIGYGALESNETGSNNTATGYDALQNNDYEGTGISDNTADGAYALYRNTTGADNTASGYQALFLNEAGSKNTAAGVNALYTNASGNYNTASGFQALYKNKSGVQNTAFGVEALFADTASYNTAVGYQSLYHNTSGTYNVAVGWKAGFAVTTGSNNIDIDNQGETGDSDTIKIGTEGTQTNTYIAGIYDVTSLTGGLTVYVDSTGHLGTASSSVRFKADIATMGSNTEKLLQLRPVTFHYKADPQSTLRYGLIAEEVAMIYPELVVRDPNGRVDGVRYDELAPMLLNEIQKQQVKLAEVDELKQQIAELRQQNQAMQAALLKLQSKDELVAQR